jgi:tRNA dimethylallyltransferase
VIGLEVPKAVLDERIAERTRAMFDAGVQDEVQQALAGPISTTARKTMGIDEIATLPPDEACAALVARTRRYASYQRKWMRRVPGIVMVDGDRPVGEIADDIVSLARTRERLPRL